MVRRRGAEAGTDPATLPALDAVDDLRRALHDRGAAVLVAPPGTGKTTAVPPALLGEDWATGRILVLEPRRLAARAAARRMAELHGEEPGGTFGHSVRGERVVSARTRVEVVTEGLLVRRLQHDPSLDGVSAVVLDEFHERSIDTDLALALLLDVRGALRADLRLLVMSATLDPAPVAELLGRDGDPAPVVEVTAPLHPVEVRYRPGSAHDRIEDRVAAVVADAVRDDPGDVLVFLPGRPEIRRTRRALEALGVPDGLVVRELHGSLPPAEQDEVVRPDPQGRRRVVLSTSLAETSITVPGVRVVVDAGRRRTVRTDPATGLPSMVTTAVSRAGAAQRSGRAGRTAPGVSYRLWAAEDERHRPAADAPEVLTGDLAELVLQVRSWGADGPAGLRWLDEPPDGAVRSAEGLLGLLGAVDGDGRLTPTGRELADVGFHPRLAAVAVEGRRAGDAELAADVVAVLETARSGDLDVVEHVRQLRTGAASHEVRRAAREWRRTLRRSRQEPSDPSTDDGVPPEGEEPLEDAVGRLLLAGHPDRVARRRPGTRTSDRGRAHAVFQLRSGGEVAVPGDHPLARSEWLVVVDLDAGARTDAGAAGRAHLAGAVTAETVLAALGGQLADHDEVRWDPDRRQVVGTRRRTLGAIVVSESPLQRIDPGAAADALRDALREHGPALLGRLGEADRLRARVECLRAADAADASGGVGWPDLSDEGLVSRLGGWLEGVRSGPELDRFDVRGALEVELGHERRVLLDRLAPTHWETASGRRVPLRYGEVDGEPGTVLASLRLRDALGTDVHPTVADGRLPVTVELLSPAGRPVQRTTDLPGFWRGSYAAVRSELRGRYPKHPWPERPWETRGRD